MYEGDPIKLKRSCEAIVIPAGSRVVIPEGTEAIIAQSLGGSYTVYIGGNLARIAGKDADALGLEPTEAPELPENASDADIEQLVWDQMKTCFDPEIPINVVDLGLIYDCQIAHLDNGKRRVDVKMTLTAPGCGMGGILIEDVKERLEVIPLIEEANVELVFDPPWNQTMMSDEAKLRTGFY
jgi:probable FeS assembly SUF system protein SufT